MSIYWLWGRKKLEWMSERKVGVSVRVGEYLSWWTQFFFGRVNLNAACDIFQVYANSQPPPPPDIYRPTKVIIKLYTKDLLPNCCQPVYIPPPPLARFSPSHPSTPASLWSGPPANFCSLLSVFFFLFFHQGPISSPQSNFPSTGIILHL